MSNKKSSSAIDPEQKEMIEKAQKRAGQKKRLYIHFILFLVGSVILILLNVAFDLGQDIRPFGMDWFVWVIIIWGVIFLLHVFNVFVTNRFFGKEWEDRQVEKLVAKQRKKIDELQQRVEREHPIPEQKSSSPIVEKRTNDRDDRLDRDNPINS